MKYFLFAFLFVVCSITTSYAAPSKALDLQPILRELENIALLDDDDPKTIEDILKKILEKYDVRVNDFFVYIKNGAEKTKSEVDKQHEDEKNSALADLNDAHESMGETVALYPDPSGKCIPATTQQLDDVLKQFSTKVTEEIEEALKPFVNEANEIVTDVQNKQETSKSGNVIETCRKETNVEDPQGNIELIKCITQKVSDVDTTTNEFKVEIEGRREKLSSDTTDAISGLKYVYAPDLKAGLAANFDVLGKHVTCLENPE